MNQNVTRWPGGFTNALPGSLFGDLKRSRPTTYFEQFQDYQGVLVSADWVSTGTGTIALVPASPNGVALFTNSAANGDETSLQYAGGTAAFLGQYGSAAGKDLIFAASVSLADVLNTAILLGLAVVDTSPIATLPTGGMFIYKPAASLYPQGYSRAASVGSNTAQSQTPMANGVMVDLSIQYIAADNAIRLMIGDAGFRLPAPMTLPGALLAPTLSIRNGTAGAKTMNIDWWYAARER